MTYKLCPVCLKVHQPGQPRCTLEIPYPTVTGTVAYGTVVKRTAVGTEMMATTAKSSSFFCHETIRGSA